MKANARPIITVLAAIVLAASVYALYVHYQLLNDPGYAAACEISDTVSCQQVFTSSYGYVFGVPVAAGGAIWSGLVLLLAGLGMGGRDRERAEATVGYIFLLSVVGLAAVFYYAYASFFVLQVTCVVCLTMYAGVVGIFLVSSSASSMSLGALPGRLARDLRATFMGPVGATLALLWLIGSVSLIAFFPKEAGQTAQAAAQTAPVPVETLEPAQLAEWRAWLDRQPRVAEMAPEGEVKVRFVKFNDYQCPSCRMTWAAYRDVVAKYEARYPQAFKFDYLDYPLEPECGSGGIHQGACEAAVAARLAEEKGRGSEMSTWLYENQANLSRESVSEAVQRIAGVNDFDSRYASVVSSIREDVQLGTKLGVSGTPTFYLNGMKLPNIRPAHLDAAIAYELEKAGVAAPSS